MVAAVWLSEYAGRKGVWELSLLRALLEAVIGMYAFLETSLPFRKFLTFFGERVSVSALSDLSIHILEISSIRMVASSLSFKTS